MKRAPAANASRLHWLGMAMIAVAMAGCGGSESEAADTAQGGGTAPSPSPSPAPAATGIATLQWSAAADSRVVGYRIYVGTSSRTYQQVKGNGANAGGSLSYVAQNLVVGRTYYFAVTAYDAASNESDYSSEAVKLIE